MARRRVRTPAWPSSFARTLGVLTRATLRAGARVALDAAAKSAVKKTAPRRARHGAPQGPGQWTSGVAVSTAGTRPYKLYRPPRATGSSHRPLLVMLHGCDQSAHGFAQSTRMHLIAAREAFYVLWPEQQRTANPQGCWNWFETRSGRAFAEAASIIRAIDQVCAQHNIDATQVAVAGFSAGASMAALLAMRYPDRFAAVAMHSGVAPGAAHSSATALSAMQGRRESVPLVLERGVAALPPLLVIQGRADMIVRASNGAKSAQLWAAATGARQMDSRSVQRGRRYVATVTDFKLGSRVTTTLCDVVNLGHAWSGGVVGQPYCDAKGPDAARTIWSFVKRQFQNAKTKQLREF
jgi:poly(hydroxyalkanoate) depolymerase family esterase